MINKYMEVNQMERNEMIEIIIAKANITNEEAIEVVEK